MNIASMLLRILAILGAVAAAVLFFILGNEKEKLRAELDDKETQVRQLQGQLSTVREERGQLEEQANKLQTQVDELEAQARNLQSQLTQLRRDLAQATQLINAREAEAESLRADAARIRRDLLAERNRIAELQQNLDDQDASALQASIRELEEQLRETEMRLQDIQRQDPQQAAPQSDEQARARIALRGEVTEVGPESAFVLINIGAAAGVRENAPVMIRRGARFVGRANVTEVHDEVSIARVQPGAGRIQPGDVAITLN